MTDIQFPLPEGNGSIAEQFRRLCTVVPDDYVGTVRLHLRDRLSQIAEEENPLLFMNLRDGVAIANRCHDLLDRYPTLSIEHRALVVGGIRYFLIHLDSIKDLTPQFGFQDDILVLNHVLEAIGLPSLVLDRLSLKRERTHAA